MEGMDIMFENLFLLAQEERPVCREDLGGLLRNILAGLFGILVLNDSFIKYLYSSLFDKIFQL